MSGAGEKRRAILLADPSAAGERLDLFIARGLAGVSRKAVKKALDGGQVFLDGRTERRAGHLLRGSETVTVTLDMAGPVPPVPELPILFRDEQLLAVDKPAGLPSHPTVAGRINALSMVTDLLRGDGKIFPPILLHRLDADTTGVLLFALTNAANRELSRQFAEREVEKIYLALVAGIPPDSISVNNFLKPGVRGRTVAVASGGQPAETVFRTLKMNNPPLAKGGGRGGGPGRGPAEDRTHPPDPRPPRRGRVSPARRHPLRRSPPRHGGRRTYSHPPSSAARLPALLSSSRNRPGNDHRSAAAGRLQCCSEFRILSL
ncbi:MAG TPA: RluA family pseudouridine synthase [Desulfuromonadales bacterium]|nr:RluA family pseudouridine synthase [Desulfuromonadales bacterium]